MDVQDLAERIRSAREKRNWSQRQLSMHAGVSPSYVNKLEAGSVPKASVTYLARIAAALKMSLLELVGEEALRSLQDNAVQSAPGDPEVEEALEMLGETTRDMTPAQLRMLARVGRTIMEGETKRYEAYRKAKPPKKGKPGGP